jgi:excisionase family DNA binding protein
MLAYLTVVVGIILLIRGKFRIGKRAIPVKRGRIKGLILIAPFILQFCYSYILLSDNISVQSDGTVTLNQEDIIAVVDNLSDLLLITILIAVAIVIYMIYKTPQSDAAQLELNQPYTPINGVTPPVPNILTVPEAAAYLRVSEGEVIRLIDDGKLAAARIGDSYRIARIAIEDFMKAGRE